METEKRTIINWISIALLLLIVVVAGVVILNSKGRIEQLSLQNQNLNTTIEQRDSLVDEMTGTFSEIEENLTFVRNKRSQLEISNHEGVKGHRESMVADIKLMNEMLEESSKKIDDLEKKLKSSGIEIKSFKNKIAKLSKTIKEQDENIQQLRAEIEKRDMKIAEMDAQLVKLNDDLIVKDDSLQLKSKLIADKSLTIEERENEINKAYFVSGSHKELVKNGVIDNEGGFLGIGKNTSIRDDFNENYFTQLDIRNANHFTLNVKKAKLISEHPSNSYRLVEENNKIAYLEIENPQDFWKLTKYVIVETKN